jgi:hypothetical protein
MTYLFGMQIWVDMIKKKLGGYSEEEIDPLHPIRRGYSKGGI